MGSKNKNAMFCPTAALCSLKKEGEKNSDSAPL